MKFSLLALLISHAALAAPEVVLAPVKHLYVPEGFDSNDAVEVVVTGEFPSPCYSRNEVKVSVKEELIDIKVTALVSEDGQKGLRACPQMVVPFKEVVTVGNLQGGDYKIQVNKETRYALQDELKVAEATSAAVDEHIYADIQHVEDKGNNNYTLHGWRYSNCVEVDKVEIVNNKKDTFSVLPIMKQVSDFCPMKGMPVSFDVKLDMSSMKFKQPLLHVRTMDGKSFNSILNLEGRR